MTDMKEISQNKEKTVNVIGSTGSIGTQSLLVIKKLNYKISALVAYSNIDLLKKQVEEFNPQYIGIIDKNQYQSAKELFKGREIICGMDALTFALDLPNIDLSIISVLGVNGIYPLLRAVKNNKTVALSNKESLVAGGQLIKDFSNILPLDSEHSAIFQCLKSGKKSEVKKLILSCSGGGFYDKAESQLKDISPKDIFHPNWKMGRKITIDSCTLMNKALEIVEAKWLFDCDNIDYIVHRESIIHSLVQFIDGSIIAQIAKPDMRLPIQYALTYPNRVPSDVSEFQLDSTLTISKKNPLFYAPDLSQYVIKQQKSAGVILNAANEAAVNLFENNKISFKDIVDIVKNCLFMSKLCSINSIDDIISVHSDTIYRVNNFYKEILVSNGNF